METTALSRGMFALSADPITNGHLDVIRRSLEYVTTLIVLIANNGGKAGRYLFSLTERVLIAKRAIAEAGLAEKVTVVASEGLLFDEFLKYDCSLLIRGIRGENDQRYEDEQLTMMRLFTDALPPSRVRYLSASPELAAVSSSFVKSAVEHGLSIERFVPAFVKALLEERILGQYTIGVTGGIASGKTYTTAELAKRLNASGYAATVVNFDELQRQLYREDSPGAARVRARLAELFGDDVLTPSKNDVERSVLKQRLFAETTSVEMRRELHELVAPHIYRLYREARRGKRGIILVEWAQLAENDLGYLVNNTAIVVEASSDERQLFYSERSLKASDVAAIAKHQWSAEQKVAVLAKRASERGHGQVVRYQNRRGDEASLSELATHIINLFGLERGGSSSS